MADKRIKDLTTSNSSLTTTDRYPVEKYDSGTGTFTTEYKTGTNIINGVLNTANQTLFNTLMTNNTGKTYLSYTSNNTSATTYNINIASYPTTLTGYYATKEYNFKLILSKYNNSGTPNFGGTDYTIIESRDYIASFHVLSDGNFDAKITQVGSSHLYGGSTMITAVTAVFFLSGSTRYLRVNVQTNTGTDIKVVGEIVQWP